MVKIKPIGEIAEKWASTTPGRAPYYESGVRAAAGTWQTASEKSEKTYEQGVQQAITRKAYGKGVREAGDEKWQRKTLAVGPSRFSEGIPAAKADMEKGFGKYHRVIETITLPARGPRGSAANYERVRKLGEALHKTRVGISGSSP